MIWSNPCKYHESGGNVFHWEMETMWFGDADGTFFDFDSISKDRKIAYPMLPDEITSKLKEPKMLKIQPKKNGEVRILSADIALMQNKKNKNDASAIFINQLIPNKVARYINNIVYTESNEGLHTADQALRIRKLYDEYMCDYIAIDVRGLGIGVADAIVRDITDPDTGIVYPALSCINDPDWAARCSNPNAPKVIWAINGHSKFNSDCAIMLREGLKAGKIRLLIQEFDAEHVLNEIKGYRTLSPAEKVQFELPYINTTLLINELINLKHDDSGGYVKIIERSGMRKDRYSSLSYNYWVACQLEAKLGKRANSDKQESFFVIRAPRVKR